jgi:hypothetical protein
MQHVTDVAWHLASRDGRKQTFVILTRSNGQALAARGETGDFEDLGLSKQSSAERDATKMTDEKGKRR